MVCTTVSATGEVRSLIMCNASAHEPQHAAWAHRVADRKPRPPMRIGSVGTRPASLCSSSVSEGSAKRMAGQARLGRHPRTFAHLPAAAPSDQPRTDPYPGVCPTPTSRLRVQGLRRFCSTDASSLGAAGCRRP